MSTLVDLVLTLLATTKKTISFLRYVVNQSSTRAYFSTIVRMLRQFNDAEAISAKKTSLRSSVYYYPDTLSSSLTIPASLAPVCCSGLSQHPEPK